MVTAEILVLLALISLNALLAMSELAVVSSRRSRLQNLVKRRHHGARMALRLLESPTDFLSTVQVGITLIGVLAGAFSGATLAEQFGAWLDTWPWIAPYGEPTAFAIVVPVITYVSLVVGELVPKRIALNDPERVASALAPVMRGIARVAAPAVWVVRSSTEGLLHVFGLARARTLTVTEDEVRMLVAEGTRAGVFMPKEREMIEGVLRLADRTARAIMTPRTEVAWLDISATPAEIAVALEARRLSRLPVCQDTIDNPLGIVHTKDLARIALAGKTVTLAEVLLPPLVVLDGTPVLKLLEGFRREGLHMAIVVDEYGTTQGVVTVADIIEAVAGALPETGGDLATALVKRSDGSWLVDGSVGIDEFEDRLGIAGLRGSRTFETVAGYALSKLGRLPVVGDTFVDRTGHYEIVDMDGRRIDKLAFRPRVDDDG
ncbi:MAG TPA: hemolysin family protein [Gammaproteobacteria bacterium]|nr:hemolysin family protein [Gammaproteobacteria bacterium]